MFSHSSTQLLGKIANLNIWENFLYHALGIVYLWWKGRSNHQEVLWKINALKCFIKFEGKHPWWPLLNELFLNKVLALQLVTLLKIRLQHRYLLGNFSDFFSEYLFYATPMNTCLWRCRRQHLKGGFSEFLVTFITNFGVITYLWVWLKFRKWDKKVALHAEVVGLYCFSESCKVW